MKTHQLHLRSGIRSQRVLCVIILVLATLLGVVSSTAYPAFAKNRGICVEARARDGSVKEIPLYSDYHALVIGCGAYKNGWPPLPNAVKDAKEVAGLFRKMGWSVDLLEDPDGNRLDTTFNRLITGKGREKDRAVLIWYSGHGHTLEEADGTRLGYIVPVDAPNPNRDEAGFMGKAMDMRRLETVAKRIRSKHVLMVFDSCFSGAIFATTRAAPSAYIQEKVAKPVRQFVTAGREDEEVPDRSVFKTCFIQGIGEGYADRNKDGYVTGEELGSYLQEKVVNYSGKAQHPQYGKINNPKLDKGDFIFLAGGIIVTQEPSPQRPKSGSMKIRSQPTGASVFVEGIDRGEAPVLLKDLSPGTFSVRVKLEGYQDQEKTISVRAGRTASVQFFLDEVVKKGRLYVTTEPEHARVKILNITPQYRDGMELEAGRYHIEVSKDGYETERQWVELAAGEDLDVQIRLKPKAVSAARPSYSSSPGKGDIWRDPVTGMEFVWVPGGCYEMGCGSWSSNCDDDEKPVHEVCVDGFWMGRYEVTQGEWKRIMGDNPSYFKKGDNYPVEKVSWDDAKEFIKKLNAKNNGSYKFRLPTEAEWEYACRSGGKNEKYCGGSDIDSLAWYSGNSGGSTHPVGTKKPNGLGIYDMSGNTWEWCEDIYAKDAYSKYSRNNPIYAGGGSDRVYRGGGWYYAPGGVRSADRCGGNPDYRDDSLGFRLLKPGHQIKKVKKNSTYFVLVIASYRERGLADKEAQRWRDAGYQAKVRRADLGPEKGIWYRVHLGDYSSVEEATSAAKKLAQKHDLRSYIVPISD